MKTFKLKIWKVKLNYKLHLNLMAVVIWLTTENLLISSKIKSYKEKLRTLKLIISILISRKEVDPARKYLLQGYPQEIKWNN